MYADEIVVTTHAIKRFKDRIDTSLSDEEIKNILKDIFKNGNYRRVRKCLIQENVKEFIMKKNKISIIVKIIKKNAQNKKGIIITCLGDNVRYQWYLEQYRKDLKKAWI